METALPMLVRSDRKALKGLVPRLMKPIIYSPIKLRLPRVTTRKRFTLLIFLFFVTLITAAFIMREKLLMLEQHYEKRPEVAHIECGRIFRGDILYAKGIPRQALVPTPPDLVDISCEAIQRRVISRRNPATGFPVAFTRVVYTDYEFLEEQLAVSYSEEHTFCYAVDRKNHDVVIKTNFEIAEIFKTMGGANDMEMSGCPNDGRCDLYEKNLGKLGLCPKNLSKKDLDACEQQSITMAKGWAEVSLARATADYILDQLNTTRLIQELHKMYYGMDELFVQSLAATRALRLPGMYPARCLYENDSVAPSNHLFITRITHWKWFKAYGCGSNIWRYPIRLQRNFITFLCFRHNICIFGVEDLPYLAGLHNIMANKLIPRIDYGAISCIGELLYNRTHYALDDHPLDYGVYENLPTVRLHKGMQADPSYFDRFPCPQFPQRKKKPIAQMIREFFMRVASNEEPQVE